MKAFLLILLGVVIAIVGFLSLMFLFNEAFKRGVESILKVFCVNDWLTEEEAINFCDKDAIINLWNKDWKHSRFKETLNNADHRKQRGR